MGIIADSWYSSVHFRVSTAGVALGSNSVAFRGKTETRPKSHARWLGATVTGLAGSRVCSDANAGPSERRADCCNRGAHACNATVPLNRDQTQIYYQRRARAMKRWCIPAQYLASPVR